MTDSAPQAPHLPAPAPRGVSPWWRVGAVTLALVVLVGWAAGASMFEQLRAQIGHLQVRLAALPQVRYVSVLLDQRQAPALLVTFDPASGQLQLQRLNSVTEGREDSMQLWALRDGAAPLSLGVVASKYKTLQLPATAQALDGVAQLAISVENKGGVPEAQGPRLPYLFQGALVFKAL